MENKDVMKEPQSMAYDVYYVVTDAFVNDYLRSVSQMAYVDVMKVMNIIKKHNNVVCIAQLNELIRTVGSFPYKYVSSLMNNINNKDIFDKYFEKQPDDFKPGF